MKKKVTKISKNSDYVRFLDEVKSKIQTAQVKANFSEFGQQPVAQLQSPEKLLGFIGVLRYFGQCPNN